MRSSLWFSTRRCYAFAVVATLALSTRTHAQSPAPALPSDTAKVAVIRQLLSETHAVDLAVTAMETSLPAQRAANPRIPAVFWDRMTAAVRKRIGDLENILIVVYDRHFSTEELQQILAFYRGPVGQKLLSEQPALVRESMLAGQEWGGRLGAEVAQQLAAEGIKIEP